MDLLLFTDEFNKKKIHKKGRGEARLRRGNSERNGVTNSRITKGKARQGKAARVPPRIACVCFIFLQFQPHGLIPVMLTLRYFTL